jgi:hypothetical protein
MRQKQNLMDAETQCLIFGRSLLLHFFSLAHQHYTTRHLVTPDHIFLLNAVRASRKRVRAHPKKPKRFWRGRGESTRTFRAFMYILRQLRGRPADVAHPTLQNKQLYWLHLFGIFR